MFAILISTIETILYLILPAVSVLVLITRQFNPKKKIRFLIFILSSGLLGVVGLFSTLLFKEFSFWIPLLQNPFFHPSSSSVVELGQWYELTDDARLFMSVRSHSGSLEEAYSGFEYCSASNPKDTEHSFFNSCWVQRCSDAKKSFSVVRQFADHYCSDLSEELKRDIYFMYQMHYPLPCDYCDCIWPDYIEPLDKK